MKKIENNIEESDEIKENEISIFMNKKSEFKNYELIVFGFIIIIISALLSFMVFNNFYNKKTKVLTKTTNLEEFNEVYDLIKSSYYKDVDDKTLATGAINGMLESLNDPHTSYFNKEETENFNDELNGSYEGIGAEITINSDKEIIVASVFRKSPAYESGMKAGDKLISVNGQSCEGKTTTEVVALIKNKNNKYAKIVVIRDGKSITLNIKKRIVVIESVESKIITNSNKKIGYIQINTFANNTYEQFREQLEEIEEKNISGLIIDLRGNSGGYLHSVSSMMDMFFSKGTVTYQIADKENITKYTDNTDESRNYPIVVLTDKSSASASEIFAIALKESYGAETVGTVTYGKGTVQTTKDLESGGMIKYTIQKWLSPKGNWINEKGIAPTYNVELSKKYINNPKEENDNQLQKAIEVVTKKIK